MHLPAPHFYRCEFNSDSPEQCGELAALAIEKAIISEGPHSVAAVIGEPVTQPMGGVVPPENYWPMVREICDRYGVLLTFDEVITGFGRLGEWFGADVVKTQPDIISFAKGITSGYFPLGGCIADRRIADAFAGGPEKTWSHMYTYSAHPGGVAAGLKNLEIMKRENLVQNAPRARRPKRRPSGRHEGSSRHHRRRTRHGTGKGSSWLQTVKPSNPSRPKWASEGDSPTR